MDISVFMAWFVAEVVSIFTWVFGVLDNLQFGGTTLLRVLIIISILIPLVAVVLTIAPNASTSNVRGYHNGRRAHRKEINDYQPKHTYQPKHGGK